MNLRRSLLLGALFAGLTAIPATFRADADESAPTGPTPYPSREADWPGVGVVRVFDWMPKYRRAFWAERRAKRGAVVFAGDSLTQGWSTLAEDFRDLRIANRGIGGDVSRGLLFRFGEDVLDLEPRGVIMLIGVNDLTARRPAAETLANVRAMLELTRARAPEAPILLCTVPPSSNPNAPVDRDERGALNHGLRELAGAFPGVFIVDLYAATADQRGSPVRRFFAPDRLHLSAAGYVRWKQVLAPVMHQAGLR